MVMRQTEYTNSEMLEDLLTWMESRAIPRFDSTLQRQDIDGRRRSLSSYSRYKTQLKIVFAKYTAGYDLNRIQADCEKMVEYFEYHLDHRVRPLDMDFDQYVLMVWTLSVSYLFNISIQDELLEKVPFLGKDMLLDRLVCCFDSRHVPSQVVAFPKVYQPLCSALGQYNESTRNAKLNTFLTNYFNGLEDKDASWFKSHLETDQNYYQHFGYWVFELSALSIHAGWDDSDYKSSPIYPKVLADWKRNKCL